MDLRRPRLGEWIAGASGALLLASLFMPWYGTDADGCPAPPSPCPPSELTAWEAFAVLDVVLALTAAMALVLLAVSLVQRAPAVAIELDSLTALVGTVVALWVLVRLVAAPESADGLDARFALLGLLAAIGLAAGAWLSMRDEGFGLRPAPGIDATLAADGVPHEARFVPLSEVSDQAERSQ